jgi:DNA polymerase-3 subunit epsilon
VSAKLSQRLLAFDLEATGLEPESDRIVEFCFLELDHDLNPISRFHSLLQPGIPMPPEVTAVHGLHDSDLDGQPTFAQFAARIQEMIDSSILVAHNCRFDLALLHFELVRAGQTGVSPNHPVIDTHAIETMVNGHNLSALYQRYCGTPLEGVHRAEADTLATIAVLRGQTSTYADVLGGGLSELLLDKVRLRNGSDGRSFLDHGRRFVRERDGTVRLNFGKLKGQPVSEHRDYLRWMLKADFADDTKRAIKEMLKSLK